MAGEVLTFDGKGRHKRRKTSHAFLLKGGMKITDIRTEISEDGVSMSKHRPLVVLQQLFPE